MTKEEFLANGKEQNWGVEYMQDMVDSQETMEQSGISIPWDMIPPPIPTPSRYP